jgi:hypothetical protein
MEIREDGGQLVLRVWQKCYPAACDWGDTPVHAYVGNHGERSLEQDAHSAVAIFANGNPGRMVLFEVAGDQLSYKVFHNYPDGGKRPNWDESGLLTRN